MKIIKLMDYNFEVPFYINVDSICYFSLFNNFETGKGYTVIFFMNSIVQLCVRETPEEIIKLISDQRQ